jgi:predicted transcriptional regulator
MKFVVQGLVFSKEGKYTNSADFYKDDVYFIGKFPKETSLLMKKIIERGILKNYTQILREGILQWKTFGKLLVKVREV